MANILRTIQKILYGVTNAGAVSTPASGEAAVGVDSTTKKLYSIDDAGTRVDYGAGGAASLGILGRNQGTPLGTGTTVDWGTGIGAAITGSVIFIHPFDGGLHGNVWRKDTGTVQGTSFAGVSIDSSDNLIGNAGGLRNFNGVQNLQTGSFTTQASDLGKVIVCNWNTGTITIHQNAPADFNFLIIQKGAGQVVISGGASGTVRNRSSHTKIAGQYGMVSVYIESNTGLAPQIYIAGDTGA